ncbi:MAG: phosphate acyltransferase [Candidatus Riflebacteria bacterium]|jgi:phosphate butyryltransferase|nr:phosphate acyltransferase [Candidatus Riflebacteria bacterium]
MKVNEKVIAIVGANQDQSLKAMATYKEKNGGHFLLYGEEEKIVSLANTLHIDLKGTTIVDCEDELEASHKAMESAKEGKVNLLMKGNISTGSFLAALLDKKYNLLEEGNNLSHVACIKLPYREKELFLSDAGVAIIPDIEKKVQIINNALKVTSAVGIKEAKVALIAPIEKVNPRIVATTDASQIIFLHESTSLFKDALIGGPYPLDVAISKEAAEAKGINDGIAGDADVVIFNSLDAANAAYKAFLTNPDIFSCGIIVGAKLPVILTSRFEFKESRIASIELALKLKAD